jgi:hypothetical protein
LNYQQIYNKIIERGKFRIKPEGYSEKHHILPKCMGGNNFSENLVKLTAREHFLYHWLLCRIYPENSSLSAAFWLMCNDYRFEYKYTARTYEEARIQFAKDHSKTMSGRNFTEEHKQNIIKGKVGSKYKERIDKGKSRLNYKRGNNIGTLGYKYTEEQRENCRKGRLKYSKEQVEEVINLLKTNKYQQLEIEKLTGISCQLISLIKKNRSSYSKVYNLIY